MDHKNNYFDTYFLKKNNNIDMESDEPVNDLKIEILNLKNLYHDTWGEIVFDFNNYIRQNIQLNNNIRPNKSNMIKIFKSFLLYRIFINFNT